MAVGVCWCCQLCPFKSLWHFPEWAPWLPMAARARISFKILSFPVSWTLLKSFMAKSAISCTRWGPNTPQAKSVINKVARADSGFCSTFVFFSATHSLSKTAFSSPLWGRAVHGAQCDLVKHLAEYYRTRIQTCFESYLWSCLPLIVIDDSFFRQFPLILTFERYLWEIPLRATCESYLLELTIRVTSGEFEHWKTWLTFGRGTFDRVGFESSIVQTLSLYVPFISLRTAFDYTGWKVTFESVLWKFTVC